MSTYREYVADREFIEDYSVYQRRYADEIRESDKVIIEIVRDLNVHSLLDIGCSTGNLLRHLHRELPDLELTGGDLTPEVLEQCRAEMPEIGFEEMNLLDLPSRDWDVIVVNAVFTFLNAEELKQAMRSLANALRPGGTLIAFDFLHRFEQDLEIRETSLTHPEGVVIRFRPYRIIKDVLQEAGFGGHYFWPFAIPKELPLTDADGGLVSFTREADHGERMLFRGTLYQPWCHLVAQT